MANTTWNPSDKAAAVTLTGSNLIATSTAGTIASVRAVDKQITGKFYWEYTYNTVTGLTTGAGALSPGFGLTTSPGAGGPVGACIVLRTGSIEIDGASSVSLGAITAGTVVGLAVDCAARLIWCRQGAAGNWNNSATANPATGVGGLAISLGDGIPFFPAACLSATSDQITANFGDSAFSGTVPSGFTSGFTSGVTTSTNALVTQAAAEHWLTTNPPAQVTQVAIEQWASVAMAPPIGRAYALTASRAGIPSAVLWQTTTRTFVVPHSAVVAEAAAPAPAPVTSTQGARVMIQA